MVHAKVLKRLIYNGRVYKVGDIFDCEENIFIGLEKRGIVERILTPDDGGENFVEEITPVEGLPSLDEVNAKSKKK